MMIHGTDEVCFRLRTKVENYAVYSALFLSASIVLVMAPSDTLGFMCRTEAHLTQSLSLFRGGEKHPQWFCEVQKRVYFYSIFIAILAHVTSILLCMSFINAFNEAARDCDIIRM